MKKSKILLFVLGGLILIAVLTNPDQDRHKEVLKYKINNSVQKSMNETSGELDDNWAVVFKGLGTMIDGFLIDTFLNNFISIDNYVLFSTTKINWAGESEIIGIGAFGNVFPIGKLDEALKKEYTEEL